MRSVRRHAHGFVLGKFLPPHHGHLHLLKVAEASCERLTILVCSLPGDGVPGELRFRWLRRLFPGAQVVHLDDPAMPQEPKDHADFWHIWKTTISRLVPEPIDAVFASEDYGWQLAQVLGADFVPVDPARAMIPISGTMVRHDPYAAWRFLPAPVRAYYAKRVAVLGPESAGKSTLTKRLAQYFDTIGVEEYARQYFDALVRSSQREPGEFRLEDLAHVARGQAALEESLAERANRLLVCDTDVLTTMTWSDHLYGRHEQWLEKEANEKQYDLTLVLHPREVAYVADGQRIMAELTRREQFFAELTGNLKAANRAYHVLTGDHEERFQNAVTLVKELFTRPAARDAEPEGKQHLYNPTKSS